MINLQFKELNIEGFQSIGNAKINFENLGTCFIKGINKYDTKTKSNGSGKSSLLMSIYWCLFGKTPAGIGNDVVNKFAKTGCFVELNISIDGVNYFIRRSQNHKEYKTNIVIVKDNEDISGRNKSDSDKLIKDILKIDEEVFSQMIFLSQGFANRFGVYTPKARKELLESLYSIDERLIGFVDGLKIKESTKKNLIDDYDRQIVKLTTQINMRDNNIYSFTDKINQLKSQVAQLENTIVSSITKEEIDSIYSQISTLETQKNTLTEKYNTKNQTVREIKIIIQQQQQEISKYQSEINKFSNNKVCPTCGTLLEDYSNNEHIQKHIKELNNHIYECNDVIAQNQILLNQELAIVDKMVDKLDTISSELSNIKREYQSKLAEYQQELQRDSQKQGLLNSIKDYEEQINVAKKEIEDDQISIKDTSIILTTEKKNLEVLQHCIRLANNQFKSYLLENIVKALNAKLQELSLSLFENEIIRITGDSKLDIMLGEKTYEQASGGEQRKCDVALIIAQRFLAQQMNAITSNILILDEVFDGLDDVSFSIVLDLLSDEIQDVESTFIISHRDIKEIPFDNVIVVTKESNQISNVQFS